MATMTVLGVLCVARSIAALLFLRLFVVSGEKRAGEVERAGSRVDVSLAVPARAVAAVLVADDISQHFVDIYGATWGFGHRTYRVLIGWFGLGFVRSECLSAALRQNENETNTEENDDGDRRLWL